MDLTLPKNAPDSKGFFNFIKSASEKYWENVPSHAEIYGFQIQKGSRWQPGLSDSEINRFEQKLNAQFPPPLRTYFSMMNGLTKSAINVYGSSGERVAYKSEYHAFPNDLELINKYIDWICESNQVDRSALGSTEIPMIFPITGHRFLIFEEPYVVLSMYENDIIPYAMNLTELLLKEIFPGMEQAGLLTHTNQIPWPTFWSEKF